MQNKILSVLSSRGKNLLAVYMLAAFIGVLLCSAPAWSQNIQTQANDMATITVEANGSARKKPDMALLNISVSNDARTAKQAMDQTSGTMSMVIKVIKEAGIDDKDMQTEGLTVQPLYEPDDAASKKPKEKRYQATNTLALKIRDLDKLGRIVDEAMANGANGINHVTLANADVQALYSEARKQAVANAMEKAKVLADAAGVTLGRVWRIEENSTNVAPMARMAVMAAPMADTPPIAAGENSYNVNISLTMELLDRK